MTTASRARKRAPKVVEIKPIVAASLAFSAAVARGGTRMRELGFRRVDIWLDADELYCIEQAAKSLKKRVATYIRELALANSRTLFKGPTRVNGTVPVTKAKAVPAKKGK